MSTAEDLDPQRANQFCVLHCCSFSTWNTTSTDFSVATLSPIFRKNVCICKGVLLPKSSQNLQTHYFFKQWGGGWRGCKEVAAISAAKEVWGLRVLWKCWQSGIYDMLHDFVFPLALGQLLAHSVTDTLLFKMMTGKWKQGRKECCLGAAGDVKNSSTLSDLLLGCCLGFFFFIDCSGQTCTIQRIIGCTFAATSYSFSDKRALYVLLKRVPRSIGSFSGLFFTMFRSLSAVRKLYTKN